MPATVTDLAQWRASHPPIVRLWDAQCRLASAWFGLSIRLGTSILRAGLGQ